MTSRAFLLCLVSSLLACATTPRPVERVPVPPQLVPTSLGANAALERAQEMLRARGFETPHPLLTWDGPAPERAFARASGTLAPDEGMGSQRCTGAIEVVQVGTRSLDGGQTQLRLSCHTERLVDGPGGPRSCEVQREAGCPEAGDQAVTRIAFDAVGF